MPTSANTGLPAPFATLTPPNPWSITPFARSGKRRASPSGSATRGRYMTWQESSGAKGRRSKALDPPGEEVEGVPIPIPPHRSFDRTLRSPAPDFPFGGRAPRPVLGQLAGSRGQNMDGGLGKVPRHITPGCRLRSSLRSSLRPTLGLSRRLPGAANGAPALRVRQPETLAEMPKSNRIFF